MRVFERALRASVPHGTGLWAEGGKGSARVGFKPRDSRVQGGVSGMGAWPRADNAGKPVG
jgi:hypothetical protein